MGVLFFRFEIHKLQKKSLKMSSDLLCQRLFFARRTGPCAKSLTLLLLVEKGEGAKIGKKPEENQRPFTMRGDWERDPLVNSNLPFD